MKNKILSWWSGGIASAVACKLIIDEYAGSKYEIEFPFCDTSWEHPDTYRFMKDFEKKFGIKIKTYKSEKYENPLSVWDHFKGLNFAHGAPCSSELKRAVRYKVQNLETDLMQVFGFDNSEEKRARNMKANYPELNPYFPLIEHNYSKEDCIKEVMSWGIEIPQPYKSGFRNNNCIGGEDSKFGGCVQGGIGYWQKIKELYPKKYNFMASLEHKYTDERGKPVTICSDQSGGKKKRVFLIKHPDYPEFKSLDDMTGRKVEPLMECNGFCSTDDPQLDLFWTNGKFT